MPKKTEEEIKQEIDQQIAIRGPLMRLPVTHGFVDFMMITTDAFAKGTIKPSNFELESLTLYDMALQYSIGMAMENDEWDKTILDGEPGKVATIDEIWRMTNMYGGPLFTLDKENYKDVANDITMQDMVDAYNGANDELSEKVEDWREDTMDRMFKVMFDHQFTSWKDSDNPEEEES